MSYKTIILSLFIILNVDIGVCQDKSLKTSVNTEDVELGFNFYTNKQYDLAQDQFGKILDSQNGRYTDIDKAWALLGKGLTFFDLSETTTAVNCLSDLEKTMDNLADRRLNFYVYRYLSACHVNLGNYAKAEDFILKAIEYATEDEVPYVKNEEVRILAFLKKNQEAVSLAYSNLDLFEKLGDNFGTCVGYTTLGQSLLQIGREEEALQAWKKCFDLAIASRQYEAVVWISLSLSNYYRNKSDIETAYRYLRYNSLYKDSLQVENSKIQLEVEAARSQAITRQQKLLEANIEKEKAKISLQRTRVFIFIFVVLLIIAILLLLIFRFRSKVREQKLYLELNRARLNPHFIFNSLNSLQKSMIEGDFESSNKYLTRFARLMRETLDQSMESFISLSREISFIEDYLELESKRFNNKFDFQIKLDESIDPDSVYIPSMLIQPIVENSIWHGLLPLEGPANICISFKRNEEDSIIICEIEDNGVGREEASRIKFNNSGPYASKGTRILKNRIDIMKRLFSSSCELSYHDKIDEKGASLGTIVRLIVPVKMEE